jgi:hypothetical protein
MCEWDWIERNGVCTKPATTRFTTKRPTDLEFGTVRRQATTVDACDEHKGRDRFKLSVVHNVPPTETPL